MYKIDKKKVCNVIAGALLSSSLFGLMGCSAPNKNVSSASNDVIKSEEYNYNHTILSFNGDTAILIPCDYYIGLDCGLVQIIIPDNYCETLPDNYSIKLSSNDIDIFDSYEDLSSYEQALNVALSSASEVYNYDDVVNGEYNNIALGYKIQSEMGITKKKDL